MIITYNLSENIIEQLGGYLLYYHDRISVNLLDLHGHGFLRVFFYRVQKTVTDC